MESLDSIFKGTEPASSVERPEAKVETTVETPAVETESSRDRDDQGRFKAKAEASTPAKPDAQTAEAPKVEKAAAPTAAEAPKPTIKPDDSPQHVPVKALQEERKKRQALEQRLAAFEQGQRQPQPKIDPLQDPEGYAQRVAQEAEFRALDRILNFSEATARRTYGDELVTEAQEAFKEAATYAPHLYQQLNSQADPYDWLIKQHKREKFLREVTDPDEWKKTQTDTIRKQLEAEFAQRQPAQPQRPAAPVPPPSLANAQSATGGISTAPAYEGPTPLTQLFRR